MPKSRVSLKGTVAIIELMSACPFILPSVPETSLIHHVMEYIPVE